MIKFNYLRYKRLLGKVRDKGGNLIHQVIIIVVECEIAIWASAKGALTYNTHIQCCFTAFALFLLLLPDTYALYLTRVWSDT